MIDELETGPTTVAQVLQRARRRILAGWGQGNYSRMELDGSISYCALGAVEMDAGIEVEDRLLKEALAALGRALPDLIRDEKELPLRTRVIVFNDGWNDGRGKERVVALYDQALTEVTK